MKPCVTIPKQKSIGSIIRRITFKITFIVLIVLLNACMSSGSKEDSDLVDHIDPTIGNVARFLVPTYPTFHLPNQMLRMVPQKKDYISDEVESFPLQVAAHRNRGLFQMKVSLGEAKEATWQNKMYISKMYRKDW